jgi:uncharacterized protein YcaQ
MARRIALAAQGFAEPRPGGRVDLRHGRRLFDRLGLIQIDSVNVLTRSQELPVFARLGPHRRDLLPLMVQRDHLFEYWAHEASLLPVEHHPLMRHRMERALNGAAAWPGLTRLWRDRPGYVEAVEQEVRDRGPLRAGELSDPGVKGGPWWGWNHGKQALEFLFWTGRLSAKRASNFERVYDVTERVIPPHVLAMPTPTETDARRELLAMSAKAHGIGTAADLCDYYRLKPTQTRHLLDELVEDGRLLPVTVEGWKDRAYLDPAARRPRRIEAQALLSPFDPVVWFRPRAERLFDFHYRIEIYTPAPKRVYGYYVLPFLLGDAIVARVDLKADRQAGVLRVQAAWREPGAPDAIVGPLVDELRAMATWLALDSVSVAERGDLAGPLRAAIGTSAS